MRCKTTGLFIAGRSQAVPLPRDFMGEANRNQRATLRMEDWTESESSPGTC